MVISLESWLQILSHRVAFRRTAKSFEKARIPLFLRKKVAININNISDLKFIALAYRLLFIRGMKRGESHRVWIYLGIVISFCIWVPDTHADLESIEIVPSFETAGLYVESTQSSDFLWAGIRLASSTENFREIHDFVRFDASHLATTLFDLSPGTEYEVRVQQGLNVYFRSFTTREFQLPAPLRIVSVHSRSELEAAIGGSLPGDEIRIFPGNYGGDFYLTRSGSEDHPVVLSGQVLETEKEKPIWERDGLPVLSHGDDYGIFISGDHVVIQNLRIQHNHHGGIRLFGAFGCVIQENQIYDNESGDSSLRSNVLITGGEEVGGRHLIQNNHVADLEHDTPFEVEVSGDPTVTYYGIKQDDDPGPGTVIRGNRIEQHYDGIHACGDEDETYLVLEDLNDVLGGPPSRWTNHDTEVYDNDIFNQRDDNLETDGICVNARFYRNRLGKSGSPVSIAPALPGPYFFVRNLMVDFEGSAVKFNIGGDRGTIRNIFFYHNTIVRTQEDPSWDNAVLYLYDGIPSQNIVFRNNILMGNHRLVIIQPDWIHRPDMDHNLWFATEGAPEEPFIRWGNEGWSEDWEGWKDRSGNEEQGVWMNPRLSNGFIPSPQSPVVNHSKVLRIPGINDLYFGSGPDFGFHEVFVPKKPTLYRPNCPVVGEP